jgi:hypothetical protein
MKIFLIFATALGLLVSAHAATTTITVDSQQYTLTYQSSVTFDANSTTIDDAAWWGVAGWDGTDANTWATATGVADIRFAYNITGNTIDYLASNGSGGSVYGQAADDASSIYAISAVAVPAPFPILGILPIVGFLKRMRRRQKAS